MPHSEFLLLPANASPDSYPNNKNNNFRVKLPKRLTLQSGKWSIGLRSIHYHNNWFNVDIGEIKLRQKNRDGTYAVHTRKVPPGRYLEAWRLLSEIRVCINSSESTNEKVTFYHDETSDTLYLHFANEDWSVKLSDDLAHVFALRSEEWYSCPSAGVKTISRRCVPDVFAGHNFMYVYCNLVAPRVVGHTLVPLLAQIAVKNPERTVETVFYEPSKPQLLPVASTDTSEVEIDIRRGDGEPFLFRSGVVSVTVELRELI